MLRQKPKSLHGAANILRQRRQITSYAYLAYCVKTACIMNRTLILLIFVFVSLACAPVWAQSDFFEGLVRYRHFIEVKDSLANEWEAMNLYGSGADFYINKNGAYFKFTKRDTIYWHSATIPTEEVVEVYPVKKEKDYLLGYTCHLLMMKVKTKGSHPEILGKMYFFAPELKVNAATFAHHKTNSQDRVMAIMQAIPLRVVVLQRHYRVIMEAEEVKERNLAADLFQIPSGLPQKELHF
jgi:hypothetical protein